MARLLSVIIPVYNVERWIGKCIDSIINQTYKNLEIILVDDGSPDNCPAICDEYAEKDKRIKVIHKKNGGLSDARNAGLEIATGEYIGFVDSDDWIEKDAYELLMKSVIEYKADIVVCGHIDEYENQSVMSVGDDQLLLNNESGMKALIEDNTIKSFVWDKVFSKTVLQNIRFPVERNFEDVAYTYQAFRRARSIVYLPKALYHYRKRSDSILGRLALKDRIDLFTNSYTRFLDLRNEYQSLNQLLLRECVYAVILTWPVLMHNRKMIPRYQKEIDSMSIFSISLPINTVKELGFGKMGQMLLYLSRYQCFISYVLSFGIDKIYRQLLRKEL